MTNELLKEFLEKRPQEARRIIEKVLLWHHHEHSDAAGDDHQHVLGPMIIFGDAVHNFIDGTIIAAAFLVDPALGITNDMQCRRQQQKQDYDQDHHARCGIQPKFPNRSQFASAERKKTKRRCSRA